MRLVGTGLLLLAACSIHVFAQPPAAPQGEVSYDLWRVRSQTITADLVKDSTALQPAERAVLWARLAQRWWRDDPEKAHAWLLKPVELVETIPNKENPAERSQRLAITRMLLKIATPLDQGLSDRLIAVLRDDAEHMADADRSANADELVAAAATIASKDPQRAAQLGALALRIGRPTQISGLLSRLRSKDEKLADALFSQAIAVARQTLDGNLLNSLTYAAFPDSMSGGGATIPAPGDGIRTELLRVDIAFLQANTINAENRNSVCAGIGSFIAPVFVHFDRLLPQQTAVVRQSLNQCQLSSAEVRQRMDNVLSAQPLNTVAALLKAADDSEDMKLRTVFYFRAAMLAKDQDDLELALKILDRMTPASRKFSDGTWESYRWDWAADAALDQLKKGDLYKMRLTLDAVPVNLQPFAKLALVSRLPAKRDKETDPTLEFLNDVRISLRQASISDADKLDGYLGLLPLTLKYQPNDATAVLKDAIATLNRVEEEEARNTSSVRNEDRSLSSSGFSKNLPAALLDMDEYAVKEAVASIASPYTRAQVRLELLGVCIQQMRISKKGNAATSPPISKGE